jgi:hypothetical protein
MVCVAGRQYRETVAGIEIGHSRKDLGSGNTQFRETIFHEERVQPWRQIVAVGKQPVFQ